MLAVVRFSSRGEIGNGVPRPADLLKPPTPVSGLPVVVPSQIPPVPFARGLLVAFLTLRGTASSILYS